MLIKRRPWREELAIIDDTMRAISGERDPEKLVEKYWDGIGDLIPIHGFVSVSRRNVEAPAYLVTRSSRFTQHFNPWTQRDRLPRFSGGLLGEIAFANKPVIIENLPDRLSKDDPAYFYLQGFQTLVSSPQYDNGEALNVTSMLFTADQEVDYSMIPTLHWQSGLFGRGTQNLVLRNQLSAALAMLDKELETVGNIQRSLLPKELPEIGGYSVAAYYETSAQAGGDYYDFFPLRDGCWGIFIADVSGHGTPAAVLMAVVHAIAHAQPDTHMPPPRLLEFLNKQLVRSYTQGGTFVTAFYAVLDPRTGELTYSMAGHNPPRLVRGDAVHSLDLNGGLPLGILEEQTYCEASTRLESGDLLLLYTDGITEAMAPLNGASSRDLFGQDRLDALLLQCGSHDPAECIEQIKKEVAEFCAGLPPTDDRTLIALRCR